MEWCVSFPKESILVYRPSLRKACGGNRSAAKFLGYLLYLASAQRTQQEDKNAPIIIKRTQQQIIEEMDEEISDRTLRDEARPCLVELGYIEFEEFKGNKQYTAYTIYPESIQRGISFPESIPHYKSMKYYLDKSARKNFRSEKVPNGSEIFPDGSEKTPDPELNQTGNISERESASESTSEATLSDVSEDPKNKEIYLEINEKKEDPFLDQNSSSQKPSKTGFIKAPVREVLQSIRDSEYRSEQYHFDRVHDLWLQCDVKDIETFRDKIYSAKSKASGGDIEYFYRCLCSALHLEQVN